MLIPFSLFISVIFLQISPPAYASDAHVSLVYQSCSTSNYSTNSSYKTSLQFLIASLVQQAPLTGFNTSSVVGNTSNRSTVYGLAQCRGDLSQGDCKQCLSTSSSQILEICPDAMAAKLQLDGCFLAYRDTQFFFDNFLLQNKVEYQSCNNETTKDDQQLQSNIETVLSTLKTDTPPKGKKFVSTATGKGLEIVYGLAQCQADLTTDDCASCLSFVVFGVLQSCNSTVGTTCYSSYCYLRYETYLFFTTPADTSAVTNETSIIISRHRSNTAIVLSVIGAAILVSVACVLSALVIRGKKPTAFTEKDTIQDHEFDSEIGPSIFTYEILSSATRNFHEDNKLGKGGFGEVYKGVFPDGREIAVKKLSSTSQQARREFLNEVKLNSCVQHRNLVRLLGCCAEASERILVYEYMENRSLDNLLFGSESEPVLDWPIRRDIIIGVARGLSYLHEDSQVRIVHRDIKLSNILVDKNFVPKIGDFGLALHYKPTTSHAGSTAKVAGTIGYLPPECAMRAQLTEKVDIFSFGVVTLEIISGRRNKDLGLPNDMQYLLEWTWRLCEEGRIGDLIDPRLEESLVMFRDEILLYIHLALLCAQEDAELRPSMSRVVLMLAGVADNSMVQEATKNLRPNLCGISGSIDSILSLEALQRAASMQRTMSRRPKTVASDINFSSETSKNVMTMSEVEPR